MFQSSKHQTMRLYSHLYWFHPKWNIWVRVRTVFSFSDLQMDIQKTKNENNDLFSFNRFSFNCMENKNWYLFCISFNPSEIKKRKTNCHSVFQTWYKKQKTVRQTVFRFFVLRTKNEKRVALQSIRGGNIFAGKWAPGRPPRVASPSLWLK